MLSSPERWLKRIPRHVWVVAYLVLVTGFLTILFASWAYDDPFITYRYAENLSRGLGLVYNPGEIRLSTTTPLFAMLLAALRPIWPDLHGLAVFIGALSLALGGLFLWDLLASPGLRFSRWAGLLFYPLFPLAASTLSSETPLYLALCLGTFTSYRRKHYRLAALTGALAALARPDAVLVAGVLGAHFLWSQRARGQGWRRWLAGLPWQAALIYLSIGVGWVVYAWMSYGSPIPATLFAKQQQALVVGSSRFLPGLLIILGWYNAWQNNAMALLALAGLGYGLRRLPAMRLVAAWTGLYFIAYSLLGVTRYFWYYAPLVPAFVLGFGLGLDGLAGLLNRLGQRKTDQGEKGSGRKTQPTAQRGRLRWATDWLLGLGLVVLLAAQVSNLWAMHLAPDSRFRIYQAAGEWLQAQLPAGTTVGTLEVGIIGYYSRQPMVDFAGVIQPEIARQLGQTRSYGGAESWAIRQYRPQSLVIHRGLFPEVEAEYLPGCELQITLVGAEYGYGNDLSIYTCR